MAEFKNRLPLLWADGKTTTNGWIAVPSILTAEIMARAGWDSITIDLQHGTADYADLLAMLAVIQQTEPCLWRVFPGTNRPRHARSRRRRTRRHLSDDRDG